MPHHSGRPLQSHSVCQHEAGRQTLGLYQCAGLDLRTCHELGATNAEDYDLKKAASGIHVSGGEAINRDPREGAGPQGQANSGHSARAPWVAARGSKVSSATETRS